jgi:hypothetical protein
MASSPEAAMKAQVVGLRRMRDELAKETERTATAVAVLEEAEAKRVPLNPKENVQAIMRENTRLWAQLRELRETRRRTEEELVRASAQTAVLSKASRQAEMHARNASLRGDKMALLWRLDRVREDLVVMRSSTAKVQHLNILPLEGTSTKDALLAELQTAIAANRAANDKLGASLGALETLHAEHGKSLYSIAHEGYTAEALASGAVEKALLGEVEQMMEELELERENALREAEGERAARIWMLEAESDRQIATLRQRVIDARQAKKGLRGVEMTIVGDEAGEADAEAEVLGREVANRSALHREILEAAFRAQDDAALKTGRAEAARKQTAICRTRIADPRADPEAIFRSERAAASDKLPALVEGVEAITKQIASLANGLGITVTSVTEQCLTIEEKLAEVVVGAGGLAAVRREITRV